MRKNTGILALISGLLLYSACQPTQPSNDIREKPPSRYGLIEIEKVLPENDNHPPILHSDEWKTPHAISGAVNSAGLEDSPFITPDGRMLLFFYTPSADIPPEKQINDQVTGIYQSELIDGIWQEPERVLLTQGNEPALDGCPFLIDDMLWFCSIREENFRNIDIWTARWDGMQWTDFSNAGAYLNQDLQIGEMHISPDGSALFYHKLDENNNNGYDLWEVHREGEKWEFPIKLDNLNSQEDDSRPALSPDGSELWFTRTHNGTPAIFRSQWKEGKWGTPELILSQFAGEPSIDSAGNIYFTHHFFQESKMVEADIYIAEKKE
ncbi:MAG: PD40 domain-containing protein [Anaerolineaceae bacterium]|nr:PD40 domain-containing protein [Anaerolineaceae bacterium]